MKKITIIDYGCGNILNLARAIEFLGYEPEITKDEKKIVNSSNVILPGVGAFSHAMKQLERHNLHKIIKDYANLKKPLLGICLGMQLLFTKSYEFGEHAGLNLIEGEVVKISNKKGKNAKIPHVGWNEIYPSNIQKKWNSKILNSDLVGKSFYFVHSFLCVTKKSESTIAICEYAGIPIPAVVSKDYIFGCQFHPEKSAKDGLSILKNFCDI
mgnify:CR=1 FL=1